MNDGRRRTGVALVTTIAVVTFIALIAVATLSLSTRLDQGSTLAVRNARLDAATSFALASVTVEWRSRSLGAIPVGATREFGVAVPGNAASAGVTVTRLGSELLWAVAESMASDGSSRRENLILRLPMAVLDSLSPLVSAGDVILSDRFQLTPDTAAGCTTAGPDLLIGPNASVTSAGGPLPVLNVKRSPQATDSTFLWSIGGVSIQSLRASADLTLADGATQSAPSGVVHATGDLTLIGGAGAGVLIVDGQLSITGPISFTGAVVARRGIVTWAPGATFTGTLRAGLPAGGGAPRLDMRHQFELRQGRCALQTILANAVMPRVVSGRRWAEMF